MPNKLQPLEPKERLKVMVSSTVYGVEDGLDRIYSLLTGFGYEVWMSGPEPGVTLTFFAQQATQQATPQVTQQVRDLLLVLSSSLSMGEILEKLDKSDRENVRANYLQAAIDLGLVEPTVPDKPKSPKQKYRFTPQGASVRKELEERSH